MTDPQGQGGAHLDSSPLWGRLINVADSQHGWCLVFQGCCGHRHLLVLLALVLPQQTHGDRRGWERKVACVLLTSCTRRGASLGWEQSVPGGG